MPRTVFSGAVVLLTLACSGEAGNEPAAPEPSRALLFEKITLHREFQCEGATIGDFDGDGSADVVLGPDLYLGPDYAERRPIWSRSEPPFDVRGYSGCFFEWAHDFDADGLLDLLMVGFPGQLAAWFQNPGAAGGGWQRRVVLDAVDGESPEWADITGDGSPELVFMTGGILGYAGPGVDPEQPWVFHPISEARGYGAFTHGLGVGDVNDDGRTDVLEATGYFLQPASLAGDPVWERVEQAFGAGGAQMEVRDVDGDGDADVVSTLAAHGYGLAWYEQGEAGQFTERVIVPNSAPELESAVILHEPHALRMADMDGDGTDDIVTGERHWGHAPEDEPFDTPGRLYWFRVREEGGSVAFEPQLVDDDSGVGTQVTVGDVDGDRRNDIVVANKKGAFVFRQE